MIKLIQFEFKKIFKNKFNVLLLILTLGACFYMIQDQTSGYYYHEEYVSLENETLNDIETMLYVDEFKHLHAGNVDKEYLEEMKDLYNSYTEKLQMDEIDDELMKTYYGNNYLEIMEAGEKGGMSVKEIQDLRKRIFDIQNNMDLSNLKDESLPNIYEYDDGTFSLNVFHKNQDKAGILSLMFSPSYEMLADKEKYLIDYNDIKNNNFDRAEYDNDRIDINFGFLQEYSVKEEDFKLLDENYVHFLNNKFLSNQVYVDSEIGLETLNRMLGDGNMEYSRFALILLIMVLASNVFAVDKSTRVDQILVCSKNGNMQTYVAKWLTLFLLAFGVGIAFILMTVFYVNYNIPIRNWNLVSSYEHFIFTYKEIILSNVGMILLCLMATTCLTGFLSCMTKNNFISAIVVLSILLFPLLIMNYSGIFKYLPSVMAYGFDTRCSWTNFMNLNGIFLPNLIFMFILWLMVGVIVIGIGYIKERRHIVN